MRTRGEDNKEDEDRGQQREQGTTTRTREKDVDNEGQRDEYKDCKFVKYHCFMYFPLYYCSACGGFILLVNL